MKRLSHSGPFHTGEKIASPKMDSHISFARSASLAPLIA